MTIRMTITSMDRHRNRWNIFMKLNEWKKDWTNLKWLDQEGGKIKIKNVMVLIISQDILCTLIKKIVMHTNQGIVITHCLSQEMIRIKIWIEN